ncbi:hypothetical protein FF38_06418 [Lucilia cuprina]|uniref:Trichohyalin-like n=1 Tax=Lucilia cuprina TaxID=7375 RepID=A0A0L0C9A9_LUCCU|nr:hypothetical protein CVS40_7298 [Lucilia cuprina]KNC28832.1 hypothetical protein FF38_06418 [Lucilia cuprina]
MLLGSWQLKTTVYVLFLALCVGQELIRTCERDYCYERSAESRREDLNDLRVEYRARSENFKSKRSQELVKDQNRIDTGNSRINALDERREHYRREETILNEARQRQSIKEERRETLKRLDDRDLIRRSNENRDQRDETKRERTERYDHLRREERRDAERGIRNGVDKRQNFLRLLDDGETQRYINRYSEDTRFSAEHLLQRNRKSIESLDDNKRERVERDETLRSLDDRQAEDTRQSQRIDERLSKQRQIGNRNVDRRADNTLQSQRIDERDSQRKHKLTQRRDENKPEREESKVLSRGLNEREARRENNRLSDNHHERVARDESSRQLDDRRQVQPDVSRIGNRETHPNINRRADNTFWSQRIDECVYQRKRELTQRLDENKPEQEERNEPLRRLNDREVQRESNILSGHERVDRDESLRLLDDRRQVQPDVSRLTEESHEQRQIDNRGNRADNTLRSRRIDERLSQRKRELTQRRDENKLEREERHEFSRRLSEGENQRVFNRHLEDNNEKHKAQRETRRRDDATSESLRINERLSEREHEATQRRDENERDETSRRRDDRHVQRDVSIRLVDNREELRVDNRKTHRDVDRRSDVKIDSQRERVERLERQETIRFDDRQVQLEVNRRSDDIRQYRRLDVNTDSQRERVERLERQESIRFDDRQVQRDVNRRSDDIRQHRRLDIQKTSQLSQREQSDIVRRDTREEREVRQKRRQNEYESLRRESLRQESRRSVDNREERQETLRQVRLFENTPESERLLQNRRELQEHGETLRRLDDSPAYHDISRRSEYDRKDRRESLRQLDEQRMDDRRLDDSQSHRESNRRFEENREDQSDIYRISKDNRKDRQTERDDSVRLNVIRKSERVFQREQEQTEIGNTFNRFVDRQTERDVIRRSEDISEDRQFRREAQREVIRNSDYDSHRTDKHLSRNERDSGDRGEEHNRELVERQTERDVIRSSEDISEDRQFRREAQREDYDSQSTDKHLSLNQRDSGDRREEHNRQRVERQTERDVIRRLEGNSEDRQFRRVAQREVIIHSDDVSQRTDKHLSLNERDLGVRREENNRERVERYETLRRFDDRETERKVNLRLQEQPTQRERKAERQNEEREHRRERVERQEQKSRIFQIEFENKRNDVEELNTERTFIFQANNDNNNQRNYRYIEDDYAMKPTVFLKKSYLFFGQGVILAFVIMKTLNGKDDLKNQLPQKLRTAVDMIGF